MGTPSAGGADLETLARVVGRVRANIEKVIEGKPDVVNSTLVVHARRGAPPDRGRARASARRCSARPSPAASTRSVRRIQFTPDLLPSDVTGVSVFNQNTREFEFRPGGVFANIVVGDEINRASPKTQSALLECMEERQVTVDNTTYQLETPFMVIATQNPIEMEGTYALPEAQRDRFMARVSVGYPVEAAEIAMLNSHTGGQPARRPRAGRRRRRDPQADRHRQQVYVSEAVQRYTRRAHLRDPALRASSRWAPPRARPCTWSGPPRRGRHPGPRLRPARRRTDRSRSRCSPTGCCPASRRR